MSMPVITISREYAAGGRSIASGLSEKLGIKYYDRDFVKETAKVSGYSEEDILREGESISIGSNIMNKVLNSTASYASSYDGIFKAQKEVILNLAKEPCIIVGRCADFILREAGIKTYDIFLYADIDYRLERAKELSDNTGLSDAEIKKKLEKIDKLRSTYYSAYTKKEMGYYKNYNICLDISCVGIDKSVDMLCEIIKSMN